MEDNHRVGSTGADQTEEPRMLRLTVGPPVFTITASREDRCILISWERLTSLDNVTWCNTWCFRWGWPPIAHFRGFYTDEPEAMDETTIQRQDRAHP